MKLAHAMLGLLVVVLTAANVFALEVTLASLTCEDQHEVAGDDEILVEIHVDGKLHSKSFKMDMKRGDTLSLEEKLTFSTNVQVTVYDQDGTAKQQLGQTTISAAGAGTDKLSGKIRGSEHRYVLTWR